MNKVLVIGGSGFMVSHTADLLSDNGYVVTILDKVTSPWLRDDQAMVVGDAMDSNVLTSAMNKIDYVFYFFCFGHVKNYFLRTVVLRNKTKLTWHC